MCFLFHSYGSNKYIIVELRQTAIQAQQSMVFSSEMECKSYRRGFKADYFGLSCACPVGRRGDISGASTIFHMEGSAAPSHLGPLGMSNSI